ncbi:MAG TPA: TRAP transporter small permease [bacterium]|nr:TRAP transporter small permease [bacterium]
MKIVSLIIRRIENTAVVVLLGTLILVCLVQVVGRLVFKAGFVEADPLIYELVLWIGLVGAMIASREKSHITIDIVSRFLSGRWLAGIRSLTGLFGAGICFLLVWISIRFIRDERAFNDTELLGIPIWIWQLILPVSFLVIGGRYTKYAIHDVITLLIPSRKSDHS